MDFLLNKQNNKNSKNMFLFMILFVLISFPTHAYYKCAFIDLLLCQP